MDSNESSDAEKRNKHIRDRRKSSSKTESEKRTNKSKSTSREKPVQNSDSEDERYYKISKKHKKEATRDKSEEKRKKSSKRKGSSELSDYEQIQNKSKVSKSIDHSQVGRNDKKRGTPSPKRKQQNYDQYLRKYTKSKWSGSSDSARTPSPKGKNRKKGSNDHNENKWDSGSERTPSPKIHQGRYILNEKETYQSYNAKNEETKLSRNKPTVSSDSDRSPSLKRSKTLDDRIESEVYRGKKNRSKRQDEDIDRHSPSSSKKLTHSESNDRETNENKYKIKKSTKIDHQDENNRRKDKSTSRSSKAQHDGTPSPKRKNTRRMSNEESDDTSSKYRGSKNKTSKHLIDDHKKGSNRRSRNSTENESLDKLEEETFSRNRIKRSESRDMRDRSLSPRDRSRSNASNGRNRYDDSSYSQKPIKFENYWSGGMNVRKNSDNYWNKYPIRDEVNFKSTDRHEVGPRYYSSGSPKKNVEEKSKDAVSETEKQNTEKNEKTQNASINKPNPAKKKVDLLTSKTGGAYIPPAKLRMMQESITDKSSAAYQRLAWEALKKSIQGLVNKINISNIVPIVKELQRENIVRGRGLLCRAIIQAQATSPTFTHVYAALVAAINTKFPNIGELLLKRLIVQFRRGFKRNDKTICITAATFIAHLVNHQVAHEILALEILTLLVESPTDDSVEVAIAFLKECGMKLTEVSKKGMSAIFDMLRNILHEGNLEKRVQYMIEVMFQIRKDEFKAYPSIVEGLNLVYEEDQFMHLITLEEEIDTQDILNVFKFDPDYEANEGKYKLLVVDDSDAEGSNDSGESGDEDDSDDESEDEETGEKQSVIIDRTETNLVALRRTIYLTIQSSLDFEECAHKLLRMQIKPGQEIEMCHMFLDCCAEQRTYEKFYGLLSQRFCQINRTYIAPFEETFRDSYSTIHRIETDKLRNIAKLFAHLLFTDAISWEVLSTIKLNEEDTTSSSRIFIKILFLELSEYMGLAKLNQRVKDPSLQTALEGLFPRDNPKNTRFAINFFTSIGLGGLTDELREHLKTQPKPSIAVPQLVEALSSSSDSSSSDSSSSDSSSDTSSSDSSSESEDSTPERKPKKKNKTKTSKHTKTVNKKSVKTKKLSSNKKKKPKR